MKYLYKCCRCGFCCLNSLCPIAVMKYGRNHKVCPALKFKGEIAICKLAGIVPVGDGCCIKARAYKNGIEYDFASLPPAIKIKASQELKQKIALVV